MKQETLLEICALTIDSMTKYKVPTGEAIAQKILRLLTELDLLKLEKLTHETKHNRKS